MIDLMVPFVQGACYLREMRGSFSIKQVLPALCPDDPELDYAALDLIHEGTAAASSFETLHLHAPADIARIRRALLAYCRLDTLAMVHILRRLHEYATKGTGQNLCSGSP
jgi:hypothetical protein